MCRGGQWECAGQRLLRIQHYGDFAVVLDGDGEVGNSVVVEIAGGDGEAAVRGDGFLNFDAGLKRAVAFAVEIAPVVYAGGAGDVELAIEISWRGQSGSN